ncbi:MAG: Dipeptide transport system permease protein DppC, partial [uncultured Thermomicrobiales bacterium]
GPASPAVRDPGLRRGARYRHVGGRSGPRQRPGARPPAGDPRVLQARLAPPAAGQGGDGRPGDRGPDGALFAVGRPDLRVRDRLLLLPEQSPDDAPGAGRGRLHPRHGRERAGYLDPPRLRRSGLAAGGGPGGDGDAGDRGGGRVGGWILRWVHRLDPDAAGRRAVGAAGVVAADPDHRALQTGADPARVRDRGARLGGDLAPDPGRGPGAAAPRVRRGGPAAGIEQHPDHHPPHPAERDADRDRLAVAGDPRLDPDRGDALLPRSGRAGADPVLGQHAAGSEGQLHQELDRGLHPRVRDLHHQSGDQPARQRAAGRAGPAVEQL